MSQEAQTVKQPAKKTKSSTEGLRVKRETKKLIITEVAALNREKKFGRNITPDDYVILAVSLLQAEHRNRLKENSLSNKDRLELRYQEYCAQHGKVSRDEFLGKLLDSGAL